MRHYLVQHGEAVPRDDDSDRPLTAKGRADIEAVLRMVPRGEIRFDHILHSGKTRARQTAEMIADHVGQTLALEAAEGLAPDGDVSIWKRRLESDRSLMLVGHLPHLAKLASLLLTGEAERGAVIFRQGGILCLEHSGSGNWSLLWMVIPELAAG